MLQDKEGLITELRKELRVPDDEHRELLLRVNNDVVIHRIRFDLQSCYLFTHWGKEKKKTVSAFRA